MPSVAPLPSAASQAAWATSSYLEGVRRRSTSYFSAAQAFAERVGSDASITAIDIAGCPFYYQYFLYSIKIFINV